MDQSASIFARRRSSLTVRSGSRLWALATVAHGRLALRADRCGDTHGCRPSAVDVRRRRRGDVLARHGGQIGVRRPLGRDQERRPLPAAARRA